MPRLTLKWAFGFPGVSASGSQASVRRRARPSSAAATGSSTPSTPTRAASTGSSKPDGGVRSAPSVGPHPGTGEAVVYFGDAFANVYAVDVASGDQRWKVQVDDHGDAMITGAPAPPRRPGSTSRSRRSRKDPGAMPTYECCTFIGSVVALDAADGSQVWKTRTIQEEPRPTVRNSIGTQLWGPSGAAIWSAPTLDPARNRLYVATGDSYTEPAAPESDAIMGP